MKNDPLPLDLFSAAPWSEPGTSRDAAYDIAPHAGTLRKRVLDAIVEAGAFGRCTHELEEALALSGDTVRPRVWELRRAGLIVDSGLRRNTPAGRKAIVWRAAR